MTYRNRNLLKWVCMNCGRGNIGGNIVAAHSNQLEDGKGMGTKANDFGSRTCAMSATRILIRAGR